MCGLVGFITSTPRFNEAENVKFFSQGLLVDSLRGMDATGILSVDKRTKQVHTYKRAYPGHEFLQFPAGLEAVKEAAKLGIAIGHNRAKTFGQNTHYNAHPHEHGPITLVHNGSLKGHHKLTKTYRTVDTIALAEFLAENSVQKVVDEVEGAYTILWHDAHDHTMNFITNGQRPFYLAQADNERGWYFASEKRMLEWLLERNGIKVKGISSPQDYHHFKWDLNSDLQMPTIKKYTKVVKAYGGGGAASNWPHQQSQHRKADNNVAHLPHSPTQTAILRSLGLEPDDIVECWPLEWTPYKSGSQKYGYVEGYIMDEPYSEVIVNGVSKDEWEKCGEDNAFSGKVAGAAKNGREVLLRLVDFKPILFSELDEKKPDGDVAAPENDSDEDDQVLFAGPTNELLTKKEWTKLTAHGCDNCGSDIDEADHMDIAWTNGHRPICADCVDELLSWGVINPSFWNNRGRH